MVVQLEVEFRRFTLISKDEVPGFPCMVTILRSSFGRDTESEIVLAGGRGTGDLGGETTSFTPRLLDNPLSRPSMSQVLSSSHPPYPGAQPRGRLAHQWLLWMCHWCGRQSVGSGAGR